MTQRHVARHRRGHDRPSPPTAPTWPRSRPRSPTAPTPWWPGSTNAGRQLQLQRPADGHDQGHRAAGRADPLDPPGRRHRDQGGRRHRQPPPQVHRHDRPGRHRHPLRPHQRPALGPAGHGHLVHDQRLVHLPAPVQPDRRDDPARRPGDRHRRQQGAARRRPSPSGSSPSPATTSAPGPPSSPSSTPPPRPTTSGTSASVQVDTTPGRDVPVQYDFNGDGQTDLVAYRFNTAEYFGQLSQRLADRPAVRARRRLAAGLRLLRGLRAPSSTPTTAPTPAIWVVALPQPGGLVVQFGVPSVDIPAPAAYDGGGVTEIAVFRPRPVRRATDADSFTVVGPGNGCYQVSFTSPAVAEARLRLQGRRHPRPGRLRRRRPATSSPSTGRAPASSSSSTRPTSTTRPPGPSGR